MSLVKLFGLEACEFARIVRVDVVVAGGIRLSPDSPEVAGLLRSGHAGQVSIDLEEIAGDISNRVEDTARRLLHGPKPALLHFLREIAGACERRGGL